MRKWLTKLIKALMNKNISNYLTIFRTFSGIIIFYLIVNTSHFGFAFFLFIISSITDFFDGYLARKTNSTSVIGEILDPVADKILIIFSFLAIAIFFQSSLIAFSSAIIISREIWVSALRDFNSRTNNINASKVIELAKIKTAIQLLCITLYLFSIYIHNDLVKVIADIVLLIATIITIYTGYIYTRNSLVK